MVPNSYNKFKMAPPKTRHRLTKINLRVNISKVISIAELEGIFQLKFTLISTWFDKRLTYKNLQKDENINLIGNPEKIWRPEYILVNTDSDEDKQSHGGQSTYLIIPDFHSKYLSDHTQSKKSYYFPGDKNSIKKIETYKAAFECEYDMRRYPFDIQICYMEIMVAGNRDMFIDLVPEKLSYMGPDEVFSQYFVLKKSICAANVHPRRGIIVEFTMKRSLSQSLLSIYLPTIIVNLIGK